MTPSEKPAEEEYFPELHVHILKKQAEKWIKKFHEAPIKRILLYNFSSPFEGEMADLLGEEFKPFSHIYAIVFEVDADNKSLKPNPLLATWFLKSFAPLISDECIAKARSKMIFQAQMEYNRQRITGERPLESYEELLDATEPNSRSSYEERYRYFITEDFKRVYNPPVENIDPYRKDWVFCVKFRNHDLDVNIRTDEPFVVLWEQEQQAKNKPNVLDSTPAAVEPECEKFVRNLRCYFKNKSEVKFQQPGKKPKTFNYESLGFDRVITDEWKCFIRVIEGPEHFYKYGPSRTGHQRVRAYDKNRSRLTQINEKLVDFFKKEYQLETPKGFKTFEKTPVEGSGVYQFKFQIGKKIDKSKYEAYDKKDLLAEISRLRKEMNIAICSDDLSKQSKLSETSDSLLVAATLANKKGWITEREMSDFFDQIWTPQEEVYDPYENSPDSNSSH